MKTSKITWLCPKCGISNDIHSRYCRHCLHRFEITGTPNITEKPKVSKEAK